MRWLALAAAILAAGSIDAAAEPTVAPVPLGFPVSEFRGPESRVASVIGSTDALRDQRSLAGRPTAVVWGRDGGAALVLDGSDLRVVRLRGGAADLRTIERGPAAIPGSRVASAGPLTAVLTGPSREYPHEALGGSIHAKTLTISERSALPASAEAKAVPVTTTVIDAGEGAVFEDREPHLVELERGEPSIVVVRSDRTGSCLMVVSRRGGAWSTVAATPPTGEPARWLNPAPAADFLGTGQPQIALVRTPHLDGTLQLWAIEGGSLVLKAEKAGYANHVFGQPAQALAAVLDMDGDGRPELAVPTSDRRSLAIVSFGSAVTERLRIALPSPVTSGVAALGTGRDTHILAGLEDGRVVDIRP